MPLPSNLVCLGEALDITLEVKGTRTTIGWRSKHWLCADATKKRLYIVPAGTMKRQRREGERKGLAAVYQLFTEMPSRSVSEVEVKLGRPVSRGRCVAVGYRSDKWDRKKKDYQHDFRKPPRVVQEGNLYRLVGPAIRVTPAGITG